MTDSLTVMKMNSDNFSFFPLLLLFLWEKRNRLKQVLILALGIKVTGAAWTNFLSYHSCFIILVHSPPFVVTCSLKQTLIHKSLTLISCLYCIILDLQGDWPWQDSISFAKILWQHNWSQTIIKKIFKNGHYILW